MTRLRAAAFCLFTATAALGCSKSPGETSASPAKSAIYSIPVATIEDKPSSLSEHEGKALLIVNVASECGFTPQYVGLQELQDKFAGRGFSVIAFPSNQFGGQEPGSHADIKEFAETKYKATFPLYQKVEVNGPNRHPIYAELTQAKDAKGEAGDVKWNFEKFLVSADGKNITRFRSDVDPMDPVIVKAVESALPKTR